MCHRSLGSMAALSVDTLEVWGTGTALELRSLQLWYPTRNSTLCFCYSGSRCSVACEEQQEFSERIWPLNGQIDESSGKKIDNEFKNWTPAAESLRGSGSRRRFRRFPKYFPEIRVLWMIPSVWEKANVISARLVIDIVRRWFWNASLYSTTLFVCLRFVPRICEVRASFKAV